MELTLFVAEGCPACARAERKIEEVLKRFDEVILTVKKTGDESAQTVFIVPALFIDGKLYLYGEVDSEKLEQRITAELSL